jgi:hypothetical protein
MSPAPLLTLRNEHDARSAAAMVDSLTAQPCGSTASRTGVSARQGCWPVTDGDRRFREGRRACNRWGAAALQQASGARCLDTRVSAPIWRW